VIQNDANHNPGLNVAALGMMTAEDIVIEPINQVDVPAASELVRQGIGAYEEAGTVLASTFRRLDKFGSVYEAPGSTYIIAKDKRIHGTIIGGAGIGPLHGLSPAEGLGEIRDLVVNPEWRGHGIGARLLKRCLDDAKKLGYQRLYLEATPQMEQARKLFMRYGFRPVTTGAAKVGQGNTMPCYYILETLT
jgi:putative acetyltransferase